MINLTRSKNHRFTIVASNRGEAGLRLMVGEWLSEWLCREEGVTWQGEGKEEVMSEVEGNEEVMTEVEGRQTNTSDYR